MKTCILALLAIYFATVAQGNNCCSPTQWEGKRFRDDGADTQHNEFESLSYDADKKRMLLTSYDKDQTIIMEEILDYGNGKRYLIDPADQKCTVSTLEAKDFEEICVPAYATKVDKPYYLGAEDHKLDVELYTAKKEDGPKDIEVLFLVTKARCLPITEDTWISEGDDATFESSNVAGVTLGIKDESVFTPPAYCTENYFLDPLRG